MRLISIFANIMLVADESLQGGLRIYLKLSTSMKKYGILIAFAAGTKTAS